MNDINISIYLLLKENDIPWQIRDNSNLWGKVS